MLSISPLSPSNFETIVAIKVSDDQSNFVAPNVLSIAQSKVWNYLVPAAIELNGTPIGFVLYGEDPNTRRVYIVRLMFAPKFQQKGHGSATVRLLLLKLQQVYSCSEVYVSLMPDNLASQRLFRSLGFLPTGETDEDGEIVFCRKLVPNER